MSHHISLREFSRGSEAALQFIGVFLHVVNRKAKDQAFNVRDAGEVHGAGTDLINGAPPSNPLGAFIESGFLVVPEPSTWILLATGSLLLMGARKRR